MIKEVKADMQTLSDDVDQNSKYYESKISPLQDSLLALKKELETRA